MGARRCAPKCPCLDDGFIDRGLTSHLVTLGQDCSPKPVYTSVPPTTPFRFHNWSDPRRLCPGPAKRESRSFVGRDVSGVGAEGRGPDVLIRHNSAEDSPTLPPGPCVHRPEDSGTRPLPYPTLRPRR